MNIRHLSASDVVTLRRIHDDHFSHEFNFPDFLSFIGSFVVEKEGKIITAGGLRLIPEAIIITDKEASTRDKIIALKTMLQAQMFTCGRLNYQHIHAFVQDLKWEEQLRKSGFHSPKGNCLILEV